MTRPRIEPFETGEGGSIATRGAGDDMAGRNVRVPVCESFCDLVVDYSEAGAAF